MNDNELDRALNAIHQARAALPDPPQLHERAFAVPLGPRSRRGWLPGLHSGWLKSLFSATKFAVAAAIVALFGAFVLAGMLTQPREDDAADMASALRADPGSLSLEVIDFSGSFPRLAEKESSEYLIAEDGFLAMSETKEGRFTDMDDPRLNGRLRIVFNRLVSYGGANVASYAVRIDNDAGSWLGTGYGYFDGSQSERDHTAAETLKSTVLRGAGAYEGLSAIMVGELTDDGNRVIGAVFNGEVPELPEMPTAPG